jgi:hypothetical protein
VILRWSEDDLLNNTVELAMTCRWAVNHGRPARTADGRWRTPIMGHKGFPDLVLARAGLVLFRELKGYDKRGRLGKLSGEQRDWGKQLDPLWSPDRGAEQWASGGPVFDVWTPDDWPLIQATLTARARRTA